MTVDTLYKAYLRASEILEEAKQARVEAELKQIKTRRAADAAEKAYDAQFERWQHANQQMLAAYSSWVEARNAASSEVAS